MQSNRALIRYLVAFLFVFSLASIRPSAVAQMPTPTPVPTPTPAPARAGDGVNNIYGIFLAPPVYYGWDPVANMYNLLQSKGADAANLFVFLTRTGTPATYASIVDGIATRDSIATAIDYCAAHMDADDIFIWQIEDHGNGYLGRVSDDPRNVAMHGYLGVKPRVVNTDEELDFQEQGLELSILCAAGGVIDGRDFHYGMGEWGVLWYPGGPSWGANLKRFKVLSHFTDVYVEGRGLLSDNDVYLERFTDYARGDTNKNGVIDLALGEVEDWDGDGQPPYNRATGAFDEDDWGPLDTFEDNFNSGHSSIPGYSYRLFDANLDDHMDIDVNPGAVLHVDGTDLNNDGLIDGIDLNDDGDMTDWIAIDETMVISDGAMKDDEIATYLHALTNGTKIVLSTTCYSGGFIDDLSAPNVITVAASRELSEAPAGSMHERLYEALAVYPSESDKDGNGRISILEAFNYASVHPHIGMNVGMDRFQYDDNGDRIGHEDVLPNGGDGALGAVTFFDRNRPPSFSSQAATAGQARVAFNYQVTTIDADIGDPLTITAATKPAWLTFIDNGNRTASLSGTPGDADVGTHAVSLVVRDQLGAVSTQDFSITVAAPNNAPVFSASPFSMPDATDGTVYSASIAGAATDPDAGDTVTYSKVSGPAWLSVSGNGTLSGTPSAANIGANSFVVQATDGSGASAQATMILQVQPKPNNAPVFTTSPFTMSDATDGTAYTANIAGRATDPDTGDTLTYSKVSGPAWLSVSANGALSGTPSAANIGANSFVVRAIDGSGASAQATMNVQVKAKPIYDNTASADSARIGTVTGTYANTITSDNVYEKITEVLSPGNNKTSYSYLEHRWTFNVAGGSTVTFFVEAHSSVSTDGDTFAFEYSTDNLNFTSMLTVTKTADNNAMQSFAMPSTIHGPVYIRVVDTNRTGGKRTLDSINVDRMFIRSQ